MVTSRWKGLHKRPRDLLLFKKLVILLHGMSRTSINFSSQNGELGGKRAFVIMFNLHIPHQRKGQGSWAENTAVQAAQLIASPSSTSFIFISSQLYHIINSLCCIRVLIPFIQAALDSGRWLLGGSQSKQLRNATSGRWHCSQETGPSVWKCVVGHGYEKASCQYFYKWSSRCCLLSTRISPCQDA